MEQKWLDQFNKLIEMRNECYAKADDSKEYYGCEDCDLFNIETKKCEFANQLCELVDKIKSC